MTIGHWAAYLGICMLAASVGLAQTKPALTLDSIILQLKSEDEKVRQKAFRDLSTFSEKGMNLDDSLLALTAASDKYPPGKLSMYDAPEKLVTAATRNNRPELLAPLRQQFDSLSPTAKGAAMSYFVELKSNESLDLFAKLLPQYGDNLDFPGRLARILREAIPNAKLNPTLVEMLKHESTTDFGASVLLDAAENAKLPANFLASHLTELETSYRIWLKKLDAAAVKAKATAPEDYRWDDEYRRPQSVAEYFPDLLGYAGPKAERILRDSFGANDPRISYFALKSLMMLKLPLDQKAVDFVAADDEFRSKLYESMLKYHQEKSFPKAYFTQEAFARSDMVQWLVYPTELDRAPNDIELMKVVDMQMPNVAGPVSFYVFRFRTTGDHWAAKDGWMAGVAGGYEKSKMPTTDSVGDTFSSFEKYDSKTPEEHVKKIVGTIAKAWQDKAATQKP